MCIRDRARGLPYLVKSNSSELREVAARDIRNSTNPDTKAEIGNDWICLLYTSDAADERSSVDLGGRRIIKKKKKKQYREPRRMYESKS